MVLKYRNTNFTLNFIRESKYNTLVYEVYVGSKLLGQLILPKWRMNWNNEPPKWLLKRLDKFLK
jgi:hypothetical protein